MTTTVKSLLTQHSVVWCHCAEVGEQVLASFPVRLVCVLFCRFLRTCSTDTATRPCIDGKQHRVLCPACGSKSEYGGPLAVLSHRRMITAFRSTLPDSHLFVVSPFTMYALASWPGSSFCRRLLVRMAVRNSWDIVSCQIVPVLAQLPSHLPAFDVGIC